MRGGAAWGGRAVGRVRVGLVLRAQFSVACGGVSVGCHFRQAVCLKPVWWERVPTFEQDGRAAAADGWFERRPVDN